MFLAVVLLLCGIGFVLLGAGLLTDGAVGLARRSGVEEWVIGLTIVAFGTSLPELATCLAAALEGCGNLSAGNIVGGNIFNVLAVAGSAAVARPILVSRSTLGKDIPFALFATLVLLVMSKDVWWEDTSVSDRLSRADGLLMLGYWGTFMGYTFLSARQKGGLVQTNQKPGSLAGRNSTAAGWKTASCIVLGAACLWGGGVLSVNSAREISIGLAVDETLLGLTVMAVATSFPELATSIVAARKGSSSIAIGNIMGSNVFNIFLVLGFCATLSPIPMGGVSPVDWGIMLISMLMFWCFASTKRIIERWEGGAMLLLYAIYLLYVVV